MNYTVAIIGCGNRGAEVYGRLLAAKENFTVAALCEKDETRLCHYGDVFSVPEELRFTDEEKFFERRRADLLVIATMDKDHARQGIKALSLGYHLLLEKPISADRKELEMLLAAQKQYGGKVVVCHVLRYAPAYVKAAQLLKEGRIGKLVAIQAIEQVAYWHQAHSYVRGNWRRGEDTTPMILAKCCHDLDLLQYYAGARAESVSSVGGLTWFKKENAPKGAAARCLDCPYIETCPYSAKRIYIDDWKKKNMLPNVWPQIQLLSDYPITEEKLLRSLREGNYGRCVYRCDNDVVDHQLTQIAFENGVQATLTMTAFTEDCARIMRFFGTLGELELNESRDVLSLCPFGGEREDVAISSLISENCGHGGGDSMLISTLEDVLEGREGETTLDRSVESHLIGICAEQSRLAGGALVRVHGEESF